MKMSKCKSWIRFVSLNNTDFKNATGVDTWDFAQKTDLANLKSDADKKDFDKLKNAPSNLRNFKRKVNKSDADKLVPVPS